MKRLVFVLAVILVSCFMNRPSEATNAYITDVFKINLRTGPSTKNKIIAILPSGESVKVLSSNDGWSHVLLSKSETETLEGWVLSRYLITRLPWKRQVRSLREENTRLKEELSQTKKNLRNTLNQEKGLIIELKNKTQAFDKLQKKYDSLKKNATGYLELKKKYDEAISISGKNQKEVNRLTEENETLRYSERNKWFLTGAMVLFFGFIIGLLMGRKQKKSKPSFYY